MKINETHWNSNEKQWKSNNNQWTSNTNNEHHWTFKLKPIGNTITSMNIYENQWDFIENHWQVMEIIEISVKTMENQWKSLKTSGGSRRHGRSLKIVLLLSFSFYYPVISLAFSLIIIVFTFYSLFIYLLLSFYCPVISFLIFLIFFSLSASVTPTLSSPPQPPGRSRSRGPPSPSPRRNRRG